MLATPAAAFYALLNKLPCGLSGWLWNASVIFSWITLPFTVIGYISDLDNVTALLSSFYDYLTPQIMDWISTLPSWGARIAFHLGDALNWFAIRVNSCLEVWRFISYPVKEFLTELNIPFSKQLADMALLPVFLLPSLIRFLLQRSATLILKQEIRMRLVHLNAAEARLRAEDERGEGAAAGAAAGAILGMVLGPLGAIAGGIIGAAIGAAVADDGRETSPHSDGAEVELARAQASLAGTSQKLNLGYKRYRDAEILLRASLISAGITFALMVFNWAYDGTTENPVSHPACSTVRSVGEPCWCRYIPGDGIAQTPAGDPRARTDQNLCLIAP